MKHISKKVLLFGALSMLASGVPLQAIEGPPADVQKEVAQKQGFFARWTEKAKRMRLKTLMKELDQNWKPFMKCIAKGGESCPKKLIWTIRGILASIIAIVALRTIGAGVFMGARAYTAGVKEGTPRPGAEWIAEKVLQVEEFGKKVGGPTAFERKAEKLFEPELEPVEVELD